MPKKKPSKKIQAVEKISAYDRLMTLAHAGTKEAVAKLEAGIKAEVDEEKKEMLKLALEECQYFYCQPRNKKEEDDFHLLELIKRKDQRLMNEYRRQTALQSRVAFAEQELRVAKEIFKKFPTRGEFPDVGVWVAQDMLTMAKQDLEEAERNIEDGELFIETAKSLITTERYKNMPVGFMDSVHFDDEGEDDSFDNFEEYEEDDCCCCEDCGYCGPCSGFEEGSEAALTTL
jgi:hypothetical protein